MLKPLQLLLGRPLTSRRSQISAPRRLHQLGQNPQRLGRARRAARSSKRLGDAAAQIPAARWRRVGVVGGGPLYG